MAEARRKVVKYPKAQERLCSRLLSLREYYEYTQAQVAESLNVSRSQYTSLELGRSMLNFDQLASLAGLYQLTLSELLDGI